MMTKTSGKILKTPNDTAGIIILEQGLAAFIYLLWETGCYFTYSTPGADLFLWTRLGGRKTSLDWSQQSNDIY